MTQISGLSGLRPKDSKVAELTVPPYDVIKSGSPLESLLKSRPDNLWHVTLGDDPVTQLARLSQEALVEAGMPSYYIYEQRWTVNGETQRRVGFFAAVEVTDYSSGEVIRHEKTFDDKVKGRMLLTGMTGLTLEPVFLLTRSNITSILEHILTEIKLTTYEFTSDFSGESELHGIRNRIVRVAQNEILGAELTKAIAANPLYIADGHHRYHAALKGGQTHCMAYIVESAQIQAYNRVIRGVVPFATIKDRLQLQPVPSFTTPAKHQFCIYTKQGAFMLAAKAVPTDVVGKLDCSILERELYPLLGLKHEMIKDPHHFDYYPEQDLDKMKACVDRGEYDIAVALAPVSIGELIAVADAGLADGGVTVMPEKSTFFAPKILSGIVLYRHQYRANGPLASGVAGNKASNVAST